MLVGQQNPSRWLEPLQAGMEHQRAQNLIGEAMLSVDAENKSRCSTQQAPSSFSPTPCRPKFTEDAGKRQVLEVTEWPGPMECSLQLSQHLPFPVTWPSPLPLALAGPHIKINISLSLSYSSIQWGYNRISPG